MEVDRAAPETQGKSQAPEQGEEQLDVERDWFVATGPTPGPGDSDGGGADYAVNDRD
jgi:hypothetical protein